MGLANAVLSSADKLAGATQVVGVDSTGALKMDPAKMAVFQASVSGAGVIRAGLSADPALSRVAIGLPAQIDKLGIPSLSTITLPTDISGCELWLDASAGLVKADGTPCSAQGDLVSKWLDRSGNARHGTVSGTTPTYTPTGGLGGAPAMVCGGGKLVTPAFVTSAYGNAITIFCVSRESAARHTALKIKVNIPGSMWIGNNGSTMRRDWTASGLTGYASNTAFIPSLDGIDVFGVGAAEVLTLSDGVGKSGSMSESGATTAITAGSVPFAKSAVCIGGQAGNALYDWPHNISEVLVYSRYLTRDEIRKIVGYLNAKYKNQLPLIECHGNSLTSGQGSTLGATQNLLPTGDAWPCLLLSRLQGVARVRTDAYPGRTSKQIMDQSINYSRITLNGKKSVVVVWEITNDIATTGSPWAAVTRLRQHCLSLRAEGHIVAVGTALYRTDVAAAQMDIANSIVRANYAEFADVLIDFAADSRLQDINNATYFAADKIHLTNAGYVVVESLVWAGIQPKLSEL